MEGGQFVNGLKITLGELFSHVWKRRYPIAHYGNLLAFFTVTGDFKLYDIADFRAPKLVSEKKLFQKPAGGWRLLLGSITSFPAAKWNISAAGGGARVGRAPHAGAEGGGRRGEGVGAWRLGEGVSTPDGCRIRAHASGAAMSTRFVRMSCVMLLVNQPQAAFSPGTMQC